MNRQRSIGSVLLHPLWIGSLVVLVVNDHYLKRSGLLPGAVTGKLSDVAGMFVAPALVAWMLRAKSKLGIGLAHAAVGAGYAVLEVSLPAADALDSVFRQFGHRWASTSDPTDLLALLLLPLGYLWVERQSRAERAVALQRRTTALACAGVLACAASEDDDGGGTFTCADETGADCDMDGVPAPADCNDYDASINPNIGNCPGADGTESCDNGIDDDDDGYTDCDDSKCAPLCAATVEACSLPTQLVAQTGAVHGSTLEGSWALEGTCGGADAPENVYQVSGTQVGVLSFPVPPGHVAYTRTDCASSHEETACVEADATVPENGVMSIPIDPNVYTTLVIDAADGASAADYDLMLTFSVPSCQDGLLDAGEQCDDGNALDGDGCSSTCIAEPETVCSHVDPLELTTADLTFEGGSFYAASTCSGGGLSAPERGFSFTAPAAGILTVSAVADSERLAVFAESVCNEAVIACAPPAAAGEVTDLAIPLAEGAQVTIFVEGESGLSTSAPFSMTASFEPS